MGPPPLLTRCCLSLHTKPEIVIHSPRSQDGELQSTSTSAHILLFLPPLFLSHSRSLFLLHTHTHTHTHTHIYTHTRQPFRGHPSLLPLNLLFVRVTRAKKLVSTPHLLFSGLQRKTALRRTGGWGRPCK